MSETVDRQQVEQLRAALALFLEKYLNSKILDREPGTLRMHILSAKNNKKTKIKEKLINYKLLRLEERLLQSDELSLKDYYVSEFLVEELMKYVG